MTLQASGPIKLSEIQNEFQGTEGNKSTLNQYARGGDLVPTGSDENSSIGTSGNPISMSDFLGSSLNPLSSQELTVSMAEQSGFNVHYLGTTRTGKTKRSVYVGAQDGSSASIDNDARYVVEMKFRLDAGFTDSVYNERAIIGIGLVDVDPLTNAESTLDDNIEGGILLYFYNDSNTNKVEARIFDNNPSFSKSHIGGQDFVAASYATKALPNDTDYVTLRITRGESSTLYNGNYYLDFNVQIYDYTAGDWTTLWDSGLSQAGLGEIHPNVYNDAGWLVAAMYNRGGSYGLDIADVRCASGVTASPW
jgi:hypothetical protein